MSEIFEALRKAQKNRAPGDAVETAQPSIEMPRAWLEQDERAPLPATPRPSPARAPSEPWWARFRGLWSSNGKRIDSNHMLLEPGTLVAEQFRLLRTRIELAGPSTVMMTSALESEGKTICAINLAKALSMSLHSSVILIDADLRHPSTGHALSVPPHPGLVDYLTGAADWQDCLKPVDGDRLRVMPAGTSSAIAPELLGSPRLPQMVEEIKRAYPTHYVVFDAPPILLTVDPLVLARHVDHVLLVVRAGRTPRAAVMKAIELLGPERLRGIVFNDAREHLGSYYYREYYYGPPSDGGNRHG